MSKAVLISIRPKWCELIANGQKTVEVRKTRPKIETPFKCYIYCTKPKNILRYVWEKEDYKGYGFYDDIPDGYKVFCKIPDGSSPFCSPPYSGKVIGEFMCDRIDRYVLFGFDRESRKYKIAGLYGYAREIPYPAICLSDSEMKTYGGGKTLYGWHISDLKIYDKAKGLAEFHFPPEMYCQKGLCGSCLKDQVVGLDGDYAFDCEWEKPLTRPPQSWCYIEEIK